MRVWGYRGSIAAVISGFSFLGRGVASGSASLLGVGSLLVILGICLILYLRYRDAVSGVHDQ
ncbi:hypothetical protein LR032_04200 [Candidatus Bipolaricaulota bacterium]|nr:hypothetical protein [Candidatus Bipolaricaulota bacterium]